MLTPSLRDAIVAQLRPTHLGRDPIEVADQVVYELGLLGHRDLRFDDLEVRQIAEAVATGVPF